VQDYRIEANTIKEAEAKSKLVKLLKHSTPDLDDSKFCRFRRVGRRGENTKVALDFALSPDRVKQASDSILDIPSDYTENAAVR